MSPTSGWGHLRSPQQQAGHALAGVPAGKHAHVCQEGLPALRGARNATRGLTQAARPGPSVLAQWPTPPRGPLDNTSHPSRWSRGHASTEARRKARQRRTASRTLYWRPCRQPPRPWPGLPAAPAPVPRSPQAPPQPAALECSAHLGPCRPSDAAPGRFLGPTPCLSSPLTPDAVSFDVYLKISKATEMPSQLGLIWLQGGGRGQDNQHIFSPSVLR